MPPHLQANVDSATPLADRAGVEAGPAATIEPFQPRSSDLVPYSLVCVFAAEARGQGSLWLARVKVAAWADHTPQDCLVWAHSGLWNHQVVEVHGRDTTQVPLNPPPLRLLPSTTLPLYLVVQSPTGQLYSTLAYTRRPSVHAASSVVQRRS